LKKNAKIVAYHGKATHRQSKTAPVQQDYFAYHARVCSLRQVPAMYSGSHMPLVYVFSEKELGKPSSLHPLWEK
jgi:hypothetical protein